MKTRRPLELRIASRIRIEGDCWMWTGSLTKDGYARISVGEVSRLAHCVAFEHLVGPVPSGLNLDHLCHTNDSTCVGGPLCRHRACVNPRHLEPVTQAVNCARGKHPNSAKTYCKRGHLFDLRNTYFRPAGGRACRTCLRDRWRRLHQLPLAA